MQKKHRSRQTSRIDRDLLKHGAVAEKYSGDVQKTSSGRINKLPRKAGSEVRDSVVHAADQHLAASAR